MPKKYAVAVIDDQADERDRIRRHLQNRFILGIGGSVEDALRDLRSQDRHRRPDLWVVDMYFPEGPSELKDPLAAINAARAQLLRAEAHFSEVLGKARQTPLGGFREGRRARAHCEAPVVVFTRKGTLDNAVHAYETEKAAAVLKKPDPPLAAIKKVSPDELQAMYDKAFAGEAADIASKLEGIIRSSTWLVKHRTLIAAALVSFFTGAASSALVTWLAERLR